jgi:uncharacterized membrane protein HdeD (DUF308 family)
VAGDLAARPPLGRRRFGRRFGVAEIAALSTRPRSGRERWLGAVSGDVAFVFGIAMLARPESSLAAVINLLRVYMIVIGALRLLQALDAWHRRRSAR